ncbi:hypothetical protein HPB48_024373 [Haemaphysalis longicornis]|uniref:Uncharacterized protein n=1 Tax=Haemaphysalis longicornis TaxID=44386 RepID=A0A9J6H8J4_HAELO|nr:hypothetical protein HPB48_024373 [Haemaphysalis longicornis]
MSVSIAGKGRALNEGVPQGPTLSRQLFPFLTTVETARDSTTKRQLSPDMHQLNYHEPRIRAPSMQQLPFPFPRVGDQLPPNIDGRIFLQTRSVDEGIRPSDFCRDAAFWGLGKGEKERQRREHSRVV